MAKNSAERAADSSPSLPLEAYAGNYRDSWYGLVTVSRGMDGLWMDLTRSPGLSGPLEHWQYNTFVARWQDRSHDADAFVTFHLDHTGKVANVKLLPFSPTTDFSYDFQDLDLIPTGDTPP